MTTFKKYFNIKRLKNKLKNEIKYWWYSEKHYENNDKQENIKGTEAGQTLSLGF